MLRRATIVAPARAGFAATSMMASPMCLSQRNFTDKLMLGAFSAFLTSTTTIGLFHLIVTPVSPTLGAATIAAATTSGALCVIESSEGSGTSFGAVMGLLLGGFGGYYAKSQKEPWRK